MIDRLRMPFAAWAWKFHLQPEVAALILLALVVGAAIIVRIARRNNPNW